jgi:hypothetical protein
VTLVKPTEMTEEQILKAISKSGYLFESEISKFLANNGFFVESNVIFQDPITTKNREIDIVAETYNDFSSGDFDRVSCKIRYYFELKNNDFPLVLLTKLQFNPNTPEDIFKEVLTVPTGIEYDSYSAFTEKLYDPEQNFYTQYCSFSKKKDNEIMASHPDEFYSSLSKLCWYCEKRTTETNEFFEEMTNEYFRHWLDLPVLLLSNDLYELNFDEGSNPKLEKVKYSRLLLNFHHNDTPTSTVIYVVTKEYLKDWLLEMEKLENSVRTQMKESKVKLTV